MIGESVLAVQIVGTAFPGASAVRETLACQTAEIHRRMESTAGIYAVSNLCKQAGPQAKRVADARREPNLERIRDGRLWRA